MPDKTDHERILLMEQQCQYNQQAYTKQLDLMMEKITAKLDSFHDELANHKEFLGNGISKVIASQVHAMYDKKVIKDVVKEVQDEINSSRQQNTRKTDGWKEWGIVKKTTAIITIIVSVTGASKVLSFGFDLLAQFFEKLAGLK